MSKTPLDYTQELVRFGSISSLSNADVADHCERLLQGLQFATERIEYDDENGVRKVNIVSKRGEGTGGLAFFAHTDVVPADPWHSAEHGPFDPVVRDGRLYGRGACDMKGSIGCMLAATARTHRGDMIAPLYITLTSDEEIGYGGAAEVALRSKLFKEMVAGHSRGIIGEPTELEVVYAHKGTHGFRATSRGRAAHSSTREGLNANLAMIPFLAVMKELYEETESDPVWRNTEFDPPTMSWNIGINDHTQAVNITPPQSICTVYFRPMPGQSPEKLVGCARAAAEEYGLEFHLASAAGPLYIDPNSHFVREMLVIAEREQPRSVAYGTDGTQFTELRDMVVFGPGSVSQMHTFDEYIELDQLERGSELFRSAIDRWCC